jgi:putative copper export protein
MLDAAIVLAQWTFLAGATLAFGVALFPYYAGRAPDPAPAARDPLLAAGAALALAGALAGVTLLLLRLGGVDAAALAAAARLALLGSASGAALLLRLAAAAALFVATRRGARPATLLALAAATLATEACLGHAGAGGWTHRCVHGAHVVAAGAWLGGLVALARALRAGGRAADEARGLLLRFSAMGLAAVALIAATGACGVWLVAGGPPGPEYGRLVLVKAGLFAAMLAVAAHNRFRLAPRLAAGDPSATLPRLRRTIGLEQALGLATLLAAAALGLTDPGGR